MPRKLEFLGHILRFPEAESSIFVPKSGLSFKFSPKKLGTGFLYSCFCPTMSPGQIFMATSGSPYVTKICEMCCAWPIFKMCLNLKMRMCLYMTYSKVHEVPPLYKSSHLSRKNVRHNLIKPYDLVRNVTRGLKPFRSFANNMHMSQISVSEYEQRQGMLSFHSSLRECL